MNDSRSQSEVLEMPPKLSIETWDMEELPKMVMPPMEELPKMVMPPMEELPKMVLPLVRGMPDGYYTEQTRRPYIQNPNVYYNRRYYEGLQHRVHGNTQNDDPSPNPMLVHFVKNSRLREVVKERASLANSEKFASLAKRVSLVVVHVGEFSIKCCFGLSWNEN